MRTQNRAFLLLLLLLLSITFRFFLRSDGKTFRFLSVMLRGVNVPDDQPRKSAVPRDYDVHVRPHLSQR